MEKRSSEKRERGTQKGLNGLSSYANKRRNFGALCAMNHHNSRVTEGYTDIKKKPAKLKTTGGNK